MPRWQVLAIGATCVLICFQTDSVVAEEPLLRALALGRRQRLPQPSPLTQPWGRSAVNRTDWRNNISKVTGNRCWRFFTSVVDSEVERPSSFETVRFTACLELLFMELFFHRFNMTALSSCPTKNTFNRWCFFKISMPQQEQLYEKLCCKMWIQKRMTCWLLCRKALSWLIPV